MALAFPTAKNPGDQLSSPEWNALAAGVMADLANVRHYGPAGTVGVGGDDTAAINAAYATGRGIYFPPTATGYHYNGAGLDVGINNTVKIMGAGLQGTTVFLGASSYLVNTGVLVSNLHISGLDIQGGKGCFRQTFTGSNVFGDLTFQDCRFYGYTEAAISNECVDSPYLRVYNCTFHGANSTASMGVAWNGYGDQTKIVDSKFLLNRICIKLRRPVNVHIDNCDFLQFSQDGSAGPRVGIWLVPTANLVPPGGYGDGVPGHGAVFSDNKFGAYPAENWLSTDYRHLFADEGAGATIGTRMPVLSANSAGYIQAPLIDHPYMAGGALPIIYSTTPNVASVRGRDPVVYDIAPSYWIQYRTPPTVKSAANNFNRFDQPFGSTTAIPLSNSTHGGVWDSSMTADIPASTTAAGQPGQRAFDANYEYRCTALNTWRRTPISQTTW